MIQHVYDTINPLCKIFRNKHCGNMNNIMSLLIYLHLPICIEINREKCSKN